MKYRVVLQRLAFQDLDKAYAWAAGKAPEAATRWLERFRNAIHSLDINPDRCPLAREDSKIDIELREFHFGRKPSVFRVIYTIDGEVVRILRIRRAQRRFLSKKQIEEAAEPDE